MELVQSDRGYLWSKDGYLFKCTKFRNGIRYLKCKITTCPCTASFKEGELELRLGEHNHPKNEADLEELKFKAELKRRATVDLGRPPKEIYNQVSQQ